MGGDESFEDNEGSASLDDEDDDDDVDAEAMMDNHEGFNHDEEVGGLMFISW